jgi:hypothetical protein
MKTIHTKKGNRFGYFFAIFFIWTEAIFFYIYNVHIDSFFLSINDYMEFLEI